MRGVVGRGSLIAVLAFSMLAFPAMAIDFESPLLGAAGRQIISPYVTPAVTFTAEPSGFGDEVVGLVKNSVTSACVEPSSANQKLGTGRRAFAPGGSVGLAAFPIRATFSSPLFPAQGPVFVAVEMQTLSGATLRLRLFDPARTQVVNSAVVAEPADGTCGFPGGARARRRVTAISSQAVAFASMDVQPSGRVFVIDDFRFGTGPLAYVVNHLGPSTPGRPTLSILDTSTDTVIAEMQATASDPACAPRCGGSAHDVAFTPDGRFAYVTHACTPWIVDTSTSRLVQALDTTADINGDGTPDCFDDQRISITPDGRFAYILNHPGFSADNDVTVVDLGTNRVHSYISVGESYLTQPPLISPDSRFVYVMFRDSRPGAGDQGIVVINTSTQTVVNRISAAVLGFPAMALSPDGRFLYVGHWNTAERRIDGIDVFDTSTWSIAGRIPIRPEDFVSLAWMDVTGDGRFLYAAVGTSAGPAMAVVDATGRSVIWVRGIPGMLFTPSSFDITPDGLRAYFTDLDRDVVAAAELSRGSAGTSAPSLTRFVTIPVGPDPYGIRIRVR